MPTDTEKAPRTIHPVTFYERDGGAASDAPVKDFRPKALVERQELDAGEGRGEDITCTVAEGCAAGTHAVGCPAHADASVTPHTEADLPCPDPPNCAIEAHKALAPPADGGGSTVSADHEMAPPARSLARD